MNTGKRLTIGLVAAYLASMVLVAFAPTAVAQGTSKLAVTLDGDAQPLAEGSKLKDTGKLKPEVEQGKVKFNFIVTVPAATGCIAPITVVYTAKADGLAASWATVIPNTGQQVTTFKSSAQQTPVTHTGEDIKNVFSVTITVTTTRDAPAFQDGKYTVTAQAKAGTNTQGGCNFQDSDVLSVSYNIKNDYIARMVYEPSAYIQKTGQNKRLTFGLTMTNLGNGATKVDTAIDQTSKNKLDAVIPPIQQIVLSKAQNTQNKNVQDTFITVQTPHSNGYTNSFYSMKVTFSAISDSPTGDTATPEVKSLALSVQVQGVYVPGFDPTMMIAGLGVALLGLGLRRR